MSGIHALRQVANDDDASTTVGNPVTINVQPMTATSSVISFQRPWRSNPDLAMAQRTSIRTPARSSTRRTPPSLASIPSPILSFTMKGQSLILPPCYHSCWCHPHLRFAGWANDHLRHRHRDPVGPHRGRRPGSDGQRGDHPQQRDPAGCNRPIQRFFLFGLHDIRSGCLVLTLRNHLQLSGGRRPPRGQRDEDPDGEPGDADGHPGECLAPYGDDNPTLTGEVVGIQNGDNITATYSTTADARSSVGPYDITAALSDPDNKLGNYSVMSNKGTLMVAPAPLTVTPDSLSKVYGDTATLTGQVTGQKNGDILTATYASDGGSHRRRRQRQLPHHRRRRQRRQARQLRRDQEHRHPDGQPGPADGHDGQHLAVHRRS